jgi:hypothetical protein
MTYSHCARAYDRAARLPQYSRGQPSGRVYAFRDITQQVEAQARLRLAAKVFESSLDAIFITVPTSSCWRSIRHASG